MQAWAVNINYPVNSVTISIEDYNKMRAKADWFYKYTVNGYSSTVYVSVEKLPHIMKDALDKHNSEMERRWKEVKKEELNIRSEKEILYQERIQMEQKYSDKSEGFIEKSRKKFWL